MAQVMELILSRSIGDAGSRIKSENKNMPATTETSGDLKFLNGNFIEASALYAETLMNLDSTCSDEEMISLLQKLGDSQYSAGLYQEALATYDRLMQVQDQCGRSEREKISTYLKLAQTYYLAEQQHQAEIQYKTAYDMSELHLPPQHFLWRSVIGSYVGWLKKSQRNPELLAKLQKELATPAEFEISGDSEEQQVNPKNQTFKGKEAPKSASNFDLHKRFANLANNLPSIHDVAMRQSTRSYFNDGTKGNQTGKEISHIGAESRHRDWNTALSKNEELQKHLSMMMPSALAAFVTIVVIVVLTLSAAKPSASEFPAFYRTLSGKSFISSDGAFSFAVGLDGLTLAGKGFRKTIRPVFWRGSFRDEINLLRGQYLQYVWLYPSLHGLQDQTGVEFFLATEIEGKTIRLMHYIAARAQSFYSRTGRYPTPVEIQSMFLYRNPRSENIEQLSVYSMYTYYDRADTRSKALESSFESGQYFNNESVGKPDSVAVLCVINKPHGLVEIPDSPLESQIMYLHCFDRSGQLIKSPGSDKALLLSLVAGKTEKTEDKNNMDKYSQATFCMSANQPPVTASVLFKYFALLTALAGITVYLLWVYVRFSKEQSVSL